MQRRIGDPLGARESSSMGGILQFFDLNQANLSRKLLGHKRTVEGLEAPRNSMEFYMEAPQNPNILHDDIPYSCQLRRQSSKPPDIFPKGTIMKKLIDEEMSKRANDKRSTPSVVARLMGMDSLPSDVAKPTIFPREGSTDPKPSSSLPRSKNPTRVAPTSTPVRKTGRDSPAAYGVENGSRRTQLQLREHPQNEVLQRFKKDFEEWQASRAWEHSSSYEAVNHRRQGNATRFPACKKSAEPKHYISMAKFEEKENRSSSSSRSRHEGRIGRQLAVTNASSSSSPTRIVILKPGLEHDVVDAEEEEGSMKDFLEEVKERLKSEMLGNARNSTKERDVTISEAYFGERSPDTKQFARHIAEKIKESVTRDIRSAPVRSNEVQLERPESPKFVNRDARRLFADRLKNVHQASNERTRMAKGRMRSQSIDDFSDLGSRMNYMRTQNESNASSTFVGEIEERGVILDAAAAPAVSPRTLVRSFSAPVSGRAFGRLLLEDQHVPSGAHIRRKHEASELPLQELKRKKKKRKDGFNLKGTVSSFRQNFILKSKLFGKKIQLVDECSENHFSSLRPIVTVPSVVEKFGAMQENSTEVPPSPASLTDSSQDDFFRADHPSPVSPLETAFIADQSASKLSTDHISSMFSELEELSEQVDDHGGREEVAADKSPFDNETFGAVEDQIEGYIRNILVAAGLYGAQATGASLPRWNGSTKPIPNWVFDKIEETYSEGKLDYGETILSRRLLFDSVNEALPRVLKVPPTATSRCKFKNPGPDPMPHGKLLLGGLLSHIERSLNPSSSNESSSLDDMVAEDVRSSTWFGVLLHAEEDAIGMKLERTILADVIDELVQDILAWPAQG